MGWRRHRKHKNHHHNKYHYYNKCSFCKRIIRELPFKCRYCGQLFCSEHHIPENHHCKGLQRDFSKNQERWVNVIKEEFEKKKIEEDYIPIDHVPAIKDRSRKKFGTKDYIFLIVIVLLLLAIFAYAKGVFPTIIKKCEDGTWYNHCSNTKPLYCYQGELINNASNCGCSYGYKVKLETCEKIPTCSDGSFYSECGGKKPMYCSNGILISKASVCGCPQDTIQQGEECINKYEINPKNVSLSMIGNFVVYGGLNDYLTGLSRMMPYYDTSPSTKDFIMRDLDNEIQRDYLLSFVQKIQEKSTDKKEQARIAISIVQSIPYDWEAFNTNSVSGRYPYEVLYDMKGVCMEKADLLAFTLRELGFGVAIFEFNEESHRAVGIKCSNGNYNTNYCFIEATDYYPVGQIPMEYVGGVDIRNAVPEVIIISEGDSFN